MSRGGIGPVHPGTGLDESQSRTGSRTQPRGPRNGRLLNRGCINGWVKHTEALGQQGESARDEQSHHQLSRPLPIDRHEPSLLEVAVVIDPMDEERKSTSVN